MNIFEGAARVVGRTADATTSAAGAVGGAAINGVVGGVQGTVTGLRSGLSSGSDSTPAAILTLAAIGATGLVEWPAQSTAFAGYYVEPRAQDHPLQPGGGVQVGVVGSPRVLLLEVWGDSEHCWSTDWSDLGSS